MWPMLGQQQLTDTDWRCKDLKIPKSQTYTLHRQCPNGLRALSGFNIIRLTGCTPPTLTVVYLGILVYFGSQNPRK